MRNCQEMCADRFGRKNVFTINLPNKTAIYVRKIDGSLGSKYKTFSVSQPEED
jgi:hypothetical protein